MNLSGANQIKTVKDNDIKSTFYALDFDRCLGRSDKLQALLESIIERRAIVDIRMIQYAHKEVKKTGGSFDTATYVRRALSDQQADGIKVWSQIEGEFIAAASKQDMLEPYAKELLEILDKNQARYGIITYGGLEWQTAKLKAAGLQHIPHVITPHKEKGRLIASWQQPDKGFVIPAELMDGKKTWMPRLVLIDDKPVSFAKIPPEVQGICVSPMNFNAQTANLPANVTVVQGLAQAIEVLFGEGHTRIQPSS